MRLLRTVVLMAKTVGRVPASAQGPRAPVLTRHCEDGHVAPVHMVVHVMGEEFWASHLPFALGEIPFSLPRLFAINNKKRLSGAAAESGSARMMYTHVKDPWRNVSGQWASRSVKVLNLLPRRQFYCNDAVSPVWVWAVRKVRWQQSTLVYLITVA